MKLENYEVHLPSYSIGNTIYDKIGPVCESYGKTVLVIGGKLALEAAYDKIRAAVDKTKLTIIGKELFGEDEKVRVIHAGLECGVIGAVYPDMDMVSFGPTLRSPHTPNERCNIPSVAKYYKFVTALLENIPEKK